MSIVRKTVSLPVAVAERLEDEAARRQLSVSALVVERLERSPKAVPYAGLIDDDPNLSLKVEEILTRLRG